MRAVLVDDHRVLWPSLVDALHSRGFAEVIAAVSVDELPSLAADVAICDLHLPEGPSGPAAVRALATAGTRVLTISGVARREGVLDALEAGAVGFVPKSASAEEVADAALAVAEDGLWVSAQLAGFLLDDARRRPLNPSSELPYRQGAALRGVAQGDTLDEVAVALALHRRSVIALLEMAMATGRRRRALLRPTPAELDVLQRVACRNLSNEEIAEELTISPWTVTSRLDSIRRKYRELHPAADLSRRPPRTVALMWAAELGQCEPEDPN
jgi:DNA-binding NarL/FixJ family response regulator